MVDDEERAKKIHQYEMKGNKYPTIQYYVDMEVEEEMEHIKIMEADKKSNGIVDVAADDELCLAREQKGYSSSTCHEAQVPSRNWVEWDDYLKKKRPVPNDNTVRQESIKKLQKMTMKIEEKHQQLDKKEKENNEKKKTPTRDAPIGLKRAVSELGGTSPKWLLEKELTKSDTNPGLGRLLLRNCGKELEKFMTDEEKEEVVVVKGSTSKNKGLKVMMVDTEGKQFDLDFKQWISFNQYVLNRNWNKIVKRFELKPKSDIVQLWCFRLPAEKGSQISFAINVVKHTKDGKKIN